MLILASDMGGLIWVVVAEGFYWLISLACLIGFILAFFKTQRRLVGRIGVATTVVIVVLYLLLFGGGITFGNPFNMDDLFFVVAMVLPPLVSISLILISRRDSSPPNPMLPKR